MPEDSEDAVNPRSLRPTEAEVEKMAAKLLANLGEQSFAPRSIGHTSALELVDGSERYKTVSVDPSDLLIFAGAYLGKRGLPIFKFTLVDPIKGGKHYTCVEFTDEAAVKKLEDFEVAAFSALIKDLPVDAAKGEDYFYARNQFLKDLRREDRKARKEARKLEKEERKAERDTYLKDENFGAW